MQSLIYDTNRFFNNPNPFSVPFLDGQVSAGGNGVASLTLPALSTSNNGDFIILAVQSSASTGTVNTVTASTGKNNQIKFTKLTTQDMGGSGELEVWTAYAPFALNSCTISLTFNGSFPQVAVIASAWANVDHINLDSIALNVSAGSNTINASIRPTNNSLILTIFGQPNNQVLSIDQKLNIIEVNSGGAFATVDTIWSKFLTNPKSQFQFNATTVNNPLWATIQLELVPSMFYQNAMLHNIGKLWGFSFTRGNSTKGFFNQTSQIIIDNVSVIKNNGGLASESFDHFISSQDAVLVVMAGNNNNTTPFTAQINGTPLSLAVSTQTTNGTLQIWYMTNPPMGNNTITVFSANTLLTDIYAISLLGVNKKIKNPIVAKNNIAADSGITSPIQVAAANSMILDFLISNQSIRNLPSDQRLIVNSGSRAASFKISTSGVQSMNWTTLAGSNISHLLIALEPASAPSIWSPTIKQRNVLDNLQEPSLGFLYKNLGRFPSTFFQNSFLHTIGRIIPIPKVVINTAIQETERQSSQILIDRVVQGQTGGGATLNLQVNIPSKEAVLVVTGGSVIATGGAWQSVTFNGTPLTKIVQTGVANNSAEIWWYPYPPVGTGTLSIVPTATFGEVNANAMVLLGVDKKSLNVINTSVTDAAATATITANITPDAPNSLIIDSLAALDTTAAPIPDTSQNQMFNATQLAANEYVFSTYKLSTSGAEQMSYNLSAAVNASLVAISLRPMQAPSLWFPNIDSRSLNDVTDVMGLDAGTNPPFGSYGNKPSMFWKNSFFHTVGRAVYENKSYASSRLLDNLTAYFAFDEGTGTLITDSTNSGYNGQIRGTLGNQWTSTGKINTGINFNGADNYIPLTQTSLINTLNGSISVWFKPIPIEPSAGDYIFAHVQTANNSRIYMRTDQTGKFITQLGDGTQIGVASYIPDQWNHGVLVWSGNVGKMYLNGRLIATTSFNGLSVITVSTIGAQSAASGWFQGGIDEMGIWSRDLQDYEVKTLYNNGQGLTYPFLPNNNQVAVGIQGYKFYNQALKSTWQSSFLQTIGRVRQFQGFYPGLTLRDGLVSYWNFDDGTGNIVRDATGRAPGTWIGTLGNQWKQGINNTMGNFNGANSYVDAGHPGALQNIKGAVTLTGWVTWQGTANTQLFGLGAYAGAATDRGPYAIGFTANTLLFSLGDGTTQGALSVSFTPALGQRYFISAIWDGTKNANGLKIYVNAVLFGQGTSAIDSTGGNAASDFTIGVTGKFFTQFFYGSIDEVGVWNRNLSTDELKFLYNNGRGRPYPFLPIIKNPLPVRGVYDYIPDSPYWDNSFLQSVGRRYDPTVQIATPVRGPWRMMMGIGY
jgi:hypothetical protein